MSIADAYNHLRNIHDKTLDLLEAAGVDVICEEQTGNPVTVEFTDETDDRAGMSEVDYKDLCARQMETIDALRGALGVLGRAIDSMAPRVGSPAPDTEPVVPPGCLVVKEENLAGLYQKLEGMQRELESVEDPTPWLERASVLLGHGGRVDDAFMRFFKGFSRNTLKPSRFLLPDGSHTDALSDALAEWRALSPEKEAEALRIANERKMSRGPVAARHGTTE